MNRFVLFTIIIITFLCINTFGDFINTPSLNSDEQVTFSLQDYKSSGNDFNLKTSSFYYKPIIKQKFSLGLKYSNVSSSESNTKYISDSIQYDFLFNNGKNTFCITYKDFRESGFYDAVIFNFGMVGIGYNFNGSDNIDSIAGFGGYDYTNFLKKKKLVKPLYSSDFIPDMFFIFNREFYIKSDLSLKYDYNGDYSTYSLLYKFKEFAIEFGKRDKGDYDKLSELAGIKLSTSFFRFIYKLN
ncbi:MAG: hypothetical protein M0R46_10860 [Candidatus Muirbacterium halophilum]|nr:hypothetical protein [Candidatus Muirbacterium halophilum]MCK9476414.1 hypothetical protein [Candidatus Muirbacterium halophilum]